MAFPAYSHLAISVADLARATTFYTVALGFTAGPTYTSKGRRVQALMECEAPEFDGVFMRLGDVLVELLCYRPPLAPAQVPRRPDEVGYAHISLAVDDIDTAIAAVENNGGALRSRMELTFVDGATKIGFVTDPDGNRVELIEHTTPGERVAHGEYLGLAGLGWPAVAR